MAHEKVYGVCEDKCLVETYGKADLDSKFNSKLNTSDVVDNLTSTATDKALSANQGNLLNSRLKFYEKVIPASANTYFEISYANIINTSRTSFLFFANGNGEPYIGIAYVDKIKQLASAFMIKQSGRSALETALDNDNSILTITTGIAWDSINIISPIEI